VSVYNNEVGIHTEENLENIYFGDIEIFGNTTDITGS
jgi:hypothetical protein